MMKQNCTRWWCGIKMKLCVNHILTQIIYINGINGTQYGPLVDTIMNIQGVGGYTISLNSMCLYHCIYITLTGTVGSCAWKVSGCVPHHAIVKMLFPKSLADRWLVHFECDRWKIDGMGLSFPNACIYWIDTWNKSSWYRKHSTRFSWWPGRHLKCLTWPLNKNKTMRAAISVAPEVYLFLNWHYIYHWSLTNKT